MNAREIKDLFDRIKSHYTMFTYDDKKIQEWYRFLKDYDNDEVNEQFNKYLTNSYDNPPLIFNLTKNLDPIKKEEIKDIWITECDICKQKFKIVNDDMREFEKHFRKCSKIDFIDRMSMRYKKRHIASVVYYEMSDDELNKAYRQTMDYYVAHSDDTNIMKKMPSE